MEAPRLPFAFRDRGASGRIHNLILPPLVAVNILRGRNCIVAKRSPSSCLTCRGVNSNECFQISVNQMDSQELVGQRRFHCVMEQDDSVEKDWNRARASSMNLKVGMELNGLVEVPMRWLMTWTIFDDGMPNICMSKKGNI